MYLLALLGLSGFLAQQVHTAPTTTLDPRFFGPSLDVFDSLTLFDSPAFQEPASGIWTSSMSAFVSLRQIDLAPAVRTVFDTLFRDLGVDVGDRAATLTERIQLFSVFGRAGKDVDVTVSGCTPGTVTLTKTAGLPDLGHVSQNVTLGTCDTTLPLAGTARVGSREFTATIFPSPPDGFGIISGECRAAFVRGSLPCHLI